MLRHLVVLPLPACLLAGCVAEPSLDPLDLAASRATAVDRPFVIRIEGESDDIDAATGGELSSAAALRLALEHDPRIQAAAARVRAALAESRQARLLPNPLLSIVVRFPEHGGKSMIDAGLSADLVSLLRRPGEISAADHRLRARAAEAISTVLDVATEAQQAYTKVQSADALHAVAESRRSLLSLTRDVARNRLQAGEGARLDVLTVESELASLDIELTDLASQRRVTRLALARLIGRPSMPVEFGVAPIAPVEVVELPEGNWIETALANRPEVAAAAWELAALGEQVKLSPLSLLDGGEIGVEAQRDGDWAIGPAVSTPIPLFDFGQARRQEVEARRIEARHNLTAARRRVIEEVRRAIEQLHAAQAALSRVSAELIPLQEQRREQSQNAYRAGLADITAVRLAEQDLQTARARQIELQAQAIEALLALHRAVGGSGLVPRPAPATTSPATPEARGITGGAEPSGRAEQSHGLKNITRSARQSREMS